MSRPLFLRWSLVNTLFTLCVAVVAVSHGDKVDGQARWFVLAILALFAGSSLYGGLLCWRADSTEYGLDGLPTWEYDLSGVRWLSFNGDMCQYLGLLGAATGFLVALSGDGLGSVQDRVAGASIGLAATAMGVACSMVLFLEAELLRRP